jgi:hypothetical protein
MKSLVVTKDNRVIVKSVADAKQVKPLSKRKVRNKGAQVTCPCCNAEIPFSLLCKQIVKRKFNRTILLNIIKKESPLTSGILAHDYHELTGDVISFRVLNNVLREFSAQGLITAKVCSKGRYGRTTVIKCSLTEASSR